MYQNYFGLAELPFELTANPRYLFLTARQREALSVLQYGLFAAKPITVLIGEAGTGKTSLIRAALQSERCRDVRAIYVDNPLLSTDDFVRMLALKFDLGTDALHSKSILLTRLEATLRERRARGEIVALVVDEAQGLNVGVLEELRLLANIETPMAKLLPLVLAGQPELGQRLEQPELRQLKQRITLRAELTPFEVTDTAGYIAGRIKAAGGVASRLFTQEAVLLIHEASRGIARSINVICDNALLNAMALGLPRVDRAMVIEVCRDLKLNVGLMNQPVRPAAPHAQSSQAQARAAEAPPPEPVADEEPAPDQGRASGSVSQRIFRFPFRFGASAAVQRFQQNGQ
jgi:general secretion pathway protein A